MFTFPHSLNQGCSFFLYFYCFVHFSFQTNPDIDYNKVQQRMVNKETTLKEAVGPPVGCLMATFGTNMTSCCIFDFDDPEELN